MQYELAQLHDRYAFCDPAGGKKQAVKRVRARSAIVVIAADSLLRIFTLYTFAERCSTDRLIRKLIEVGENFRPRLFGIEANAMQSTFADAVRREARLSKKRIPFVDVFQPTKVDKDFRVRAALQPVIAEGRLFTQEKQLDLRSELLSFPMSPTKDLIDALASAVSLVPARAVKPAAKQESDALAAYLRNTGAPAWYIQQRVQELRGVA